MQTLKLTKERLKAVRDGSLVRLVGSNRDFYKGVEVSYDGGNDRISRIVYSHSDTLFISENSFAHEELMTLKNDGKRDQERFARALTFVPTYTSFAEFLSRMRKTRHAQKLSDKFKAMNEKTAEFKMLIMFYITWLMIPSWAKSEAEFNQYWGADLAAQFPFNSPSRQPL